LLSNEFFPHRIHKNRCWLGLRPSTGGAYSALPDPLTGFKGAASRQEGYRGERRTKGKGERGKEGKGVRERKRGNWGE